MAHRFIPDYLINCFFQFRIHASAAHKPPQVCTFLILEASFHESFGCKTYSVALTAEFVSHGTDKSDFSLKSCDFIVMAWAVSVAFIDCMHRTVGFFQYCFDRFFILEWELFSKSDWHHLDKTHMDWIFLRQSCNPDEVFFFLDHRTLLIFRESPGCASAALIPSNTFFQSVTSRYFFEQFRIQSIQTDINGVNSCIQ
mgnify:FL=1